MVLAEDLRKSVLQAAMLGNLTERCTDTETVEIVLEKIAKEREHLVVSKEMKKDKTLFPTMEEAPSLDIPETWKWVQLGTLCTKIGAGSTPAGGRAVYVSNGIKFIREQNVRNEGLLLDDVAYIKEETHVSMKGSQVKAQDILLNITGASIGRNSLVPDDFDTANINQHVLIIRLADKRMREYIHFCLCSPLIYAQMLDKQKGDKPGLSAQKVGAFYIPVPPIQEQQYIVEKLKIILSEIDIYAKTENKLDALQKKFPKDFRNSILQAAIQGKITKQNAKESVLSIISQCKLDKEKAISEGKYKKEKFRGALNQEDYPFDIPDNWAFMYISDMALFQEGPGILAVDFRKEGVPLIRIAGMRGNRVSIEGCNYLDEKSVEERWKHFKLDKGDIVISTSASMDKIAEVDDEAVGCIPYTGLIRFKMYAEINKEYFKYFIKSPFYTQQINEQKAGGMIKHYGPTHLKKMLFVLPPIEEQQRIVERLNEILPLVDDVEEV